tara:strand:+ start:1021 stop:2013 length:993 start_codon:yes stop_codon:yes gene_type:complete
MSDLFSNQTEIPWLNSYEKSWKKIIQNKKVPHAIFISGNRGIGKRSFAAWIASQHLNITKKSKCCIYPFAIPSHADLKWISPNEGKRDIGVNQIRQIIDDLTMSSYEGIGKVAVIEPANKMNISSANSLLKILEEPPGNTLIILIADMMKNIPVTIISRCQHIKVYHPEEKDSRKFINHIHPDANILKIDPYILRSPLIFEEQNNHSNNIETIIIDLMNVLNKKHSPLDLAARLSDEEANIFLDWFSYFIYSLARNVHKVNKQHNKFEKILDKLDISNLFIYFDKINKIRNQSKGSYNFRMILEELFIDWSRGLKDLHSSETKYQSLPAI